jgi:hypothetical protein
MRFDRKWNWITLLRYKTGRKNETNWVIKFAEMGFTRRRKEQKDAKNDIKKSGAE